MARNNSFVVKVVFANIGLNRHFRACFSVYLGVESTNNAGATQPGCAIASSSVLLSDKRTGNHWEPLVCGAAEDVELSPQQGRRRRDNRLATGAVDDVTTTAAERPRHSSACDGQWWWSRRSVASCTSALISFTFEFCDASYGVFPRTCSLHTC